MTRTRRVIAGAGYGYLHMAVVTLVGLWLTPFLLTRLGQSDLGLWLVVQQALGYALLMDLGVVALLPREVAFETGRAGPGELPPSVADVVGRTVSVVLWQVPIVAVVGVLAWIAIPDRLFNIRGPAALLLIVFVAMFPLRVFQAALTGLQDLGFVGRVTLAGWTISTALTIALVLAGFGLHALAIGWAAGQLAGAAGCGFRLYRRFRFAVPTRIPRLSLETMREYMARSIWISIGQVAHVLLHGSDLLVIGWVLGPAAVVSYACTSRLLSVLSNQPHLLMQSAAPALSEIRTAASPERLEAATSALTQAMLLLTGAVACVVIAVNEGFVVWWVGGEYYAGFGLTLLLIAAMLLRHWNTTAVYALFARGYDRHLSLTALADGAVSVAVGVVCVWLVGPAGAAIGAIAGAVLVSLPANLRLLGREAGFSAWRVAAPLVPWAVRFVPSLAGAAALALLWDPQGLVRVALLGCLVALSYAVITGPMAFRPPLGLYVRPWLAWRS